MALVNQELGAHRRLGMNATPTMVLPQKSDQTFVKGAPVNLNASGEVIACATQSVTTGAAVDASEQAIGIAGEPAVNGTTAKRTFTPFTQGMMFKGQLMTSETSAALVTTLQEHVGDVACLTLTTSDVHYGVDIGATAVAAEPLVKIVEIIELGVSGGLVGFVLLDAASNLYVA